MNNKGMRKIKLKHVLAGVSFLSMLVALEVISVPVASGIVALYSLTKTGAFEVWIGASLFSGFSSFILHHLEGSKRRD